MGYAIAAYGGIAMKRLLIAIVCLVFSAPALAQTADTDPATRDDVILYLQTMHTHDLMRRTMEVQMKNVQQLLHDQLLKDKGQLPADYDVHMRKAMEDLLQTMPMDEITQAMIPAYQAHFTRGDIAAMNAFYSSPVGQKVLQELPAVMQEGSQAAMPIMSKYLADWLARMKPGLEPEQKSTPEKTGSDSSVPN